MSRCRARWITPPRRPPCLAALPSDWSSTSGWPAPPPARTGSLAAAPVPCAGQRQPRDRSARWRPPGTRLVRCRSAGPAGPSAPDVRESPAGGVRAHLVPCAAPPGAPVLRSSPRPPAPPPPAPGCGSSVLVDAGRVRPDLPRRCGYPGARPVCRRAFPVNSHRRACSRRAVAGRQLRSPAGGRVRRRTTSRADWFTEDAGPVPATSPRTDPSTGGGPRPVAHHSHPPSSGWRFAVCGPALSGCVRDPWSTASLRPPRSVALNPVGALLAPAICARVRREFAHLPRGSSSPLYGAARAGAPAVPLRAAYHPWLLRAAPQGTTIALSPRCAGVVGSPPLAARTSAG